MPWTVLRWLLLALVLTFPGTISLLDCTNRAPEEFLGGAPDRRSWLTWLALAVPLCAVGIGYGIVLGYYYGVIRRNSPTGR
jgi:hypothetical protein